MGLQGGEGQQYILITVIREVFTEEETFELNMECYEIWIGRFRNLGGNSSNFDNLDVLGHSQPRSLALDKYT